MWRRLATVSALFAITAFSSYTSHALTYVRRARLPSQVGVRRLGGDVKCEYCSSTLRAKERVQTHDGEQRLIVPKKSFICNKHWCSDHGQPRPDGKECAMCKVEKRMAEEKFAERMNEPKKPLNGLLGIKFGDMACEESGFEDYSSELIGLQSSRITTSASFNPKKRFRTYTRYRVYFLPLSKRIYKIECSWPIGSTEKLTDDQEREIQVSIIEKRYEGKMKCGRNKTGTMHFAGTGPLGRKISLDFARLSAVDLDLQAQLDEEMAAVRKTRQAKAVENIKPEDIDAL